MNHPSNALFLSERLIFEKPLPSDLITIERSLADPRMLKYLGSAPSKQDLLERLSSWIACWESGVAYCGIVVLRSTLTRIGTASIHPSTIPGQDGYEISYMITPEYQGCGYGSEMADGLVGYSFNTLRISRLLIDVHPGNERSNRIAEKLGFQLLGLFHYQHAGFTDFFDHNVWVREKGDL